jgi:hypothetical protein
MQDLRSTVQNIRMFLTSVQTYDRHARSTIYSTKSTYVSYVGTNRKYNCTMCIMTPAENHIDPNETNEIKQTHKIQG